MEQKSNWVLCPACGSKTRIQIRIDTMIANLPLYCPKCKQESLVNVHEFKISIVED